MNMQRKKPRFIRQGGTYLKRLGEKWRRPKGNQSKLRMHHKSRGSLPDPGYGSPRELRYMHPSGFKEKMIFNLNDLNSVNPEKEAIRIASTIGRKKKLQIMEYANANKIKVLNPFKTEEKVEKK